MLTWWDEAQNHLIALQNVTVGPTVRRSSMGMLPLSGWWTEYSGYVFNDKNRNGRARRRARTASPTSPLTMRKRDNSLMDRGQTTAVTDANGYYTFEGAYPLGEFGFTVHGGLQRLVLHHRRHLPGRQPADPDHGQGRRRRRQHPQHHRPRRHHGLGRARLRPQRHQRRRPAQRRHRRLDQLRHHPQRARPAVRRGRGLAARRPRHPGRALRHGRPAAPTRAPLATRDGRLRAERRWLLRTGQAAEHLPLRELGAAHAAARLATSTAMPLVHGVDEDHLALDQETDGNCIPAFSQSVQFGTYATDQGTPDANFGATVDGNYGFGDGCFDGTLDASDPANPVCMAAPSRRSARRLPGQLRHPQRPAPARRCTR